MKRISMLVLVLVLSACASVPSNQSSFNGYNYTQGPTSSADPRLRQPQFYMDESESMPWLKDAPRSNK